MVAQLLHRREFSITPGDDVYIRYLSYEDAAGFVADVRRVWTNAMAYNPPATPVLRCCRAALVAPSTWH